MPTESIEEPSFLSPVNPPNPGKPYLGVDCLSAEASRR
jgi:hypothetical protein